MLIVPIHPLGLNMETCDVLLVISCALFAIAYLTGWLPEAMGIVKLLVSLVMKP